MRNTKEQLDAVRRAVDMDPKFGTGPEFTRAILADLEEALALLEGSRSAPVTAWARQRDAFLGQPLADTRPAAAPGEAGPAVEALRARLEVALEHLRTIKDMCGGLLKTGTARDGAIQYAYDLADIALRGATPGPGPTPGEPGAK